MGVCIEHGDGYQSDGMNEREWESVGNRPEFGGKYEEELTADL